MGVTSSCLAHCCGRKSPVKANFHQLPVIDTHVQSQFSGRSKWSPRPTELIIPQSPSLSKRTKGLVHGFVTAVQRSPRHLKKFVGFLQRSPRHAVNFILTPRRKKLESIKE